MSSEPNLLNEVTQYTTTTDFFNNSQIKCMNQLWYFIISYIASSFQLDACYVCTTYVMWEQNAVFQVH